MASSAILALDVGLMEDEERREMRHNIVDFAWRTAQKPLNYTLAASGSLYAYMANSGVTPDFLWYGVGGALCGEFLHKAVRKVKSSDLIHAMTVDTKDCLEPLINSDLIVSDRHIGQEEQEDNKWHVGNIYKNKAVVGTVLATTMTAIDFAATGGANAGLVAGATAVTIPFWGYNIPQDTVAHIGFGFFGAMIGTALLPFAMLKNKLFGQGKGGDDTNPEPD